jgi:hypothetical protein
LSNRTYLAQQADRATIPQPADDDVVDAELVEDDSPD